MKITMKSARKEYRLYKTKRSFREWLRNKFRDDFMGRFTYDEGSKVEKIAKTIIDQKQKVKKSGVRYACEVDGWTSEKDGLDCRVCPVTNSCPFDE